MVELYFLVKIHTSFKGNSTTMFSNNTANEGGAVVLYYNSFISFELNSITVFRSNNASYGGAIIADSQCSVTFDNDSTVFFNNNTATFGGAIFSTHSCKIIVKGTFIVLFDDLPAKWCNNACLLAEKNAFTIENDGIIWCNSPETFICLSNKCYCKNLKDMLTSIADNEVINITEKAVVLSSVIDINSHNISIIGHNNPAVICVNGSGSVAVHEQLL